MGTDWTKIQSKYGGLWVALAEDEKTVLASGGSAKDAYDKARKGGHEDPILTRMPEALTAYVGSGYEV
ncbi:MAG: DUF5678 domain-containing protein [Patescibacteria group bacterium]